MRFAGRKFDKDGNAIEWWTPETIREYEKLAQCFVDQYNGYLVPGLEDFNIYVSNRALQGNSNLLNMQKIQLNIL